MKRILNHNGMWVWLYPEPAPVGYPQRKLPWGNEADQIARAKSRFKETGLVPAVTVYVPKQHDKIVALFKHCKMLDGTELCVLRDTKHEHTPHPVGAEFTIRYALTAFKDTPMYWMEADSVPFRENWQRAVSDEYKACGKPFLMPGPPSEWDDWDVASALGVYPPGAIDMLPEAPGTPPWWDLWLLDNLSGQIAWSKIIQHRYGFYENEGKGRHVKDYCKFPKHDSCIWPSTYVFHADKYQSLMERLEKRFYHSGDIGDIIAALPIMRLFGNVHLQIGENGAPRESMRGKRYAAISPLLAAQPYIKNVTWVEGDPIVHYDLSQFRKAWTGDSRESLADWQARFLGRKISLEPWLTVPNAERHDRVVIARSWRYHNPDFPWLSVLKKFPDAIFVGLPEEFQSLRHEFGEIAEVEYHPTSDLLEVATIVAGASRVFTNQTATWWIAAGLGVETIQESWTPQLNSIIKRPNLYFTRNAQEVAHLQKLLRNW